MGTVAALGHLADLAEAQNGLLTARQANIRGVPRRDLARLVRVGGMERVAYGIYRVAGAPRPRLLELRAAWLQLAPDVDIDRRTVVDGVVSHASAAAVCGVGLLEPVRHEFSVPLPRRVRSRRDDVVIHRTRLAEDDVGWVEEMLVTVPTRMVADLCAQSIDGEHLAGVVADLLDRQMADPGELALALAPYAHQYGGQPEHGDEFLDYLLTFAPGTVGFPAAPGVRLRSAAGPAVHGDTTIRSSRRSPIRHPRIRRHRAIETIHQRRTLHRRPNHDRHRPNLTSHAPRPGPPNAPTCRGLGHHHPRWRFGCCATAVR